MLPQYQDIMIGDIVSQVKVKLRINPSKSYLLNDLNIGLKKLIDSGEIEKIYDKYQ